MTTSRLVPAHNYNTRFRKMVQKSSIDQPKSNTSTKNNSFQLVGLLMESQANAYTTSKTEFVLTTKNVIEFSLRTKLDKRTRINTCKFIYDFLINNKQHITKKLYTAMVDKLEDLRQQGFPHEEYLYYVPKLEMVRKEKGF